MGSTVTNKKANRVLYAVLRRTLKVSGGPHFDLFCGADDRMRAGVVIIVQQITDRGINDLASLTLGYILRIGGLYIFLSSSTWARRSSWRLSAITGHKDRDRHAPRHVRTTCRSSRSRILTNTKIPVQLQSPSRLTCLTSRVCASLSEEFFHCGHQDHRRIW